MTKEKNPVDPKPNFKPKIKNLEIKNFRGIDHLKIDKLSKINIFVGRNGIGKTSILEALWLLAGKKSKNLMLNAFRKIDNVILDDYLSAFYKLDINKNIQISSGIKKVEITTLSLQENIEGDIANINDINQKIDTKENYKKEFLLNYYENNNLKLSTKEKMQDNQLVTEIIKKEKKFNLNEESALIIDHSVNVSTVDSFLNDNKEKDLVFFLQKINRHIEGVRIDTNKNILFKHKEMNKFISKKFFGDGISKLFSFYLGLYSQKDQYAVIDEIENGLHYRSQEIAWKVIMEESAKNNTDLFITTHSYEMLESLVKVLGQEENEKYRNLFSIYNLFKNPNKENKLDINSYQYNDFKEDIQDKIEIR